MILGDFFTKTYGVEKKQPGLKSKLNKSAPNTVQYNEQQHWTAKGEQKRSRCRECANRTAYICKTCNLPVHSE